MREEKQKPPKIAVRRSPVRLHVSGEASDGYVRRYLLRQNQNGYIATFESLQNAHKKLKAEYEELAIGATLTIARQNDNIPSTR